MALYKKMNISYFEKTIQKVKDRTNVEFIPHSEYVGIKRRQSKLGFKGIVSHYSEFSVYEYKGSIVVDKPMKLGFSVLELSKLVMHEFYFDKFLAYWGNNVQLYNKDTDSYILSIKTENLIKKLGIFQRQL